MLLRSTIGNPDFNRWWFIVWECWKWGKFWLLISIWPWRSWPIATQNNRDLLNQGLLHHWSKFGDPSINSWWVTSRTSSWLMGTHTHSHTHTQAMTISEGQIWPWLKIWNNCKKMMHCDHIMNGIQLYYRYCTTISPRYLTECGIWRPKLFVRQIRRAH